MNLRAPPATWVTLALCAGATLAEGFDIQSTGLVAPQYRAEFHLDHSQQGLIFGLNNFGMFAGSIVVGWATDRFGRRWAAILSMVLFGAFSVACAFARSGNQFALLRFLLGLCLGGSMANVIAITAEAGSAAHRVARVTVMSSALAVGGAIPGVILGLWPQLGWRWIYQLGGWAPIAVGVAMWLKLAESAPYLEARRRLGARSGAPPRINAFLELLSRGRRAASLMLWLAALLTFLVYYVSNNWLPSLLVERAFSTRQASFSAALFTSGGAVGTILVGLLLGVASRGLMTLVVFSGCIAALFALAFATGAGPIPRSMIMPAVFALGLFVTTAKNMLYGVAPLYYPAPIRGTGVGTALAFGRIGSILGPAAAGLLLGAGQGAERVLLDLAPVMIMAMLACLLLARMHDADDVNLPGEATDVLIDRS
jgi:AAHS family 3-hydroxyphenylpropionic acid transporter